MDMNKDMVHLNAYGYDELQPVISAALAGKIELYAISTLLHDFIALQQGTIQEIVSCHPERSVICLNAVDEITYPKGIVAQSRLATGEAQSIGVNDLWINKSDFLKFSSLQREGKSIEGNKLQGDNNALIILGAIVSLMLDTPPANHKHSIFQSQSAIQDALESRYSNTRGFSKSQTEKIFANAKKALERALITNES